ncbi:MAG: hypothetical protein ACO3ID_11385, partial [Candidatus Nanopelagicales bacterium]
GIKGDQEQERRATSALLAVIQAVPEFARALLKPLGAPAGRLGAFIEPAFAYGDKKVRPDGLIVVERAGKTWSAAVEVKTNKNDLGPEQLNMYLDLCRENGIGTLITISNQIVTLSGAHPTDGLDGRRLRKTTLQHFSWMRILAEAQLQKEHRGISDPDQAWILGELIRYLQAPASGALQFSDMGESWVRVRQGVLNGTLTPSDDGAFAVVQRFESLLRYASFRLSARLGVDVRPVVSKAAKDDPAKHAKSVVAEFAKDAQLRGALRVEDTVAPLEVAVDLRSAQIMSSVRVDAPKEGRPLTRVNWVLRQLKAAPAGVRIETYVKRAQAPSNVCLLGEALQKPELLVPADGREITAFTATLISPMGTARGEGKRSFVDSFLNAVDTTYKAILESLQAWAPKAPKLLPTSNPLGDEEPNGALDEPIAEGDATGNA